MTCGVVRPAIVLPADAPGWNPEDLERALVHELAHVARNDWAIHCVARAVCALYWFHPLVWMALRRLELEAERACDDAVLERSEATAYADQLVAVARRLSAGKSPVLAMANRKDLELRVKSVLDGGRRRGRAGRWCVALASAASVALLLTVSPLRIVAAPQTANLPRLRSDTRLVVSEVKVLYPNGKTVEGLGPGDFEITENGVPQSIQICEFRKEDAVDPGSGVYLVGYYSGSSKADGQFRKLNVAVKTVTVAKVEHRAGFYLLQNVGYAQSAVTSSRGEGGALPYDRPPQLIFKKEPEYTEEARKAKYQGTVLLEAEVDETGKTSVIQVVRSLGLGLDEKAVEAVRQWRFKPGVKAEKPVRVRTEVEVIFRLL
jgi:TonB family protein